MIPSNTLQFLYFCDFNKCLWAIFSQLSFKNLSGYIFWVRLLRPKIIKNGYKSPLIKACELKVWVKLPPDVFQNVKTVQQRKPNLNFIRVIKIHLLIKVLYRLIWCNLSRRYFLFYALNISLY